MFNCNKNSKAKDGYRQKSNFVVKSNKMKIEILKTNISKSNLLKIMMELISVIIFIKKSEDRQI